jgi:hypothetical protein
MNVRVNEFLSINGELENFEEDVRCLVEQREKQITVCQELCLHITFLTKYDSIVTTINYKQNRFLT